ncbi:hypothetical protein [Aliarcobacter butzleri]|uniref:hypothetical protein n=1 Tax=Aliarcobacter butzleri TaxID=28197 RepID=UPI00344B7EBD
MIDFISSSILGGIIYDLLKKGFSSIEIIDKLSEKFNLNTSQINNFNIFFDENNINNNTDKIFIINAIEKNPNIQLILNNINNLNIHSENTTININNKKKNYELDKFYISYRNKDVDIIFSFILLLSTIFILLFINDYNILKISNFLFNYPQFLILHLIVIILYLFVLPKYNEFMLIHIYEDRFVYLNKSISYFEIKNYGYINNIFKFRLRNSKYFKRILLYYNDNAYFMFDAVERFSKYHDNK